MNTTSHTLAPWKRFTLYAQIEIRDQNDKLIAVVGAGRDSGSPSSQTCKDARLIEAAPNLLAALQCLQANPNDPRAHRAALDAMAKAAGTNEPVAAPRPSTPVASTTAPSPKPAKPPTAAQKRWLAAIDTGEVFRWGHTWVASLNNPRQRGGAPTRCTYVMTCDLHDGGWIDSARMERSDRDYRIFLTEAGKLALAADTKPAKAAPAAAAGAISS